ncbi:MAG: RHS repeat domain-containing protein [Victivallaceae bacterium]|nr:RHS repeat-associated core domain-containing protein [Victivallaceae bacterium]
MEMIFDYYASKILETLKIYKAAPNGRSLYLIREAVRTLTGKCVDIEGLDDDSSTIKYKDVKINNGRGFLIIPAAYSKTGQDIYEKNENGVTVCTFADVPELYEHWDDVVQVLNSLKDVAIGGPESEWGPGILKSQEGTNSVGPMVIDNDWTGYHGNGDVYYSYNDSDGPNMWNYSAGSTAFRLHVDSSPESLKSHWKLLYFHEKNETNGIYDGDPPPPEPKVSSWQQTNLPFSRDQISLPDPTPPNFSDPNRDHIIKSESRILKSITLLANAPAVQIDNMDDDHQEDGLIELGCASENFAAAERKSPREIRYDLGTSNNISGVQMHYYLTNRYVMPEDKTQSSYIYSDTTLYFQKYRSQISEIEFIFGKTLLNSSTVVAAFSMLKRPNGTEIPNYWKFEGDTPVCGLPVTNKGYSIHNTGSGTIVRFTGNIVHEFDAGGTFVRAYKEENGGIIVGTWTGITKGSTNVIAPQGTAEIQYTIQADQTCNVRITYRKNGQIVRVAESSGPGTSSAGRNVKVFRYNPPGSTTPIPMTDFSIYGAAGGASTATSENQIGVVVINPSDGTTYLTESQNFTVSESGDGIRISEWAKPNGSSTDIFAVKETLRFIAGATRVVSRSTGSGTTLRTTSYGYWDAAGTNGYGKLKYQLNPNGSWVYYCYDAYDRITSEVMPFGNTALQFDSSGAVVTPAASNCRIVEYNYSSTVTSDTPLAGDTRPRRITEKVKGTEVSRKYHVYAPNEYREEVCVSSGAVISASSNIVTTHRSYSSGVYSGRNWKTEYPDGTMAINTYVSSGGYLYTSAATGIPNAASAAIISGTCIVTKANSAGNIVERLEKDVPSGLVTDSQTYTYDLGRPATTTYMDGSVESTAYACCGPLSVTYRDGSVKTYAYTPDQNVATETYGGVVTEHYYDAAGNETAVNVRPEADGAGRWTMREYAANGELAKTKVGLQLSVDEPANSACAITTHSAAKVGSYWQKTTVNPDGGTIIEKYNTDNTMYERSGTAVARPERFSAGIISGELFASGYVLTNDGSPIEQLLKFTDFGGRQYKTIHAYGGVDYVDYDSAGRPWRIRNRNGMVTVAEYDNLGRVFRTGIAATNGSALTVSDTVTEYVRDVISSGGHCISRLQTFEYDDGVSFGSSATMVKSEDSCNANNAHVIWENGRVTSSYVVYQSDGKNEHIIYPDSSTVLNMYHNGRLDSSSHSFLGGTSYAYDAIGRLSTVTKPDGGTTVVTSNVYDGRGNITSETVTFNGSNSRVTSRTYDNMDRMTAEIQPGGRAVTYDYNPKSQVILTSGYGVYKQEYGYNYGKVVSLTTWQDDNTSAVTTWEHNYEGNVKRKHYADGVTVAYSYTADGLLRARYDNWSPTGENLYIGYAYWPGYGDRIQQVLPPNNDDEIVTTFYDRRGRVRRQKDMAGNHYFTYNSQNLLDNVTIPYYTGRCVKYVYDAIGRRTTMGIYNTGTSNWETQTVYTYENDSTLKTSRLHSISGLGKQATYTRLTNSNRISSVSFSNTGFSSNCPDSTYGYDSQLRLTHKGGWTSEFNAKDEATLINSDLGYQQYTLSWFNTYDGSGQLTQGILGIMAAEGPMGTTYDYSYDSIGNHLVDGVTVNSVNQPSNLTYDAVGNMTGDGIHTFVYDGQNRMAKALGGANSYEFFYDYAGRCYQRNRMIVDAGGEIFGSTPDEYYIYDNDKKIAVLRDGSLAEKYVWQPASSGDADVVLFDTNGIYATDANKNVTGQWVPDEWNNFVPMLMACNYTPFGEPTTSVRRFAFSSEEWLGDYGLLRYLYRDYSPSLKRFLTRDPIGEDGGVNLYNFVGNNPVTKWDNWGQVVNGPDDDVDSTESCCVEEKPYWKYCGNPSLDDCAYKCASRYWTGTLNFLGIGVGIAAAKYPTAAAIGGTAIGGFNAGIPIGCYISCRMMMCTKVVPPTRYWYSYGTLRRLFTGECGEWRYSCPETKEV